MKDTLQLLVFSYFQLSVFFFSRLVDYLFLTTFHGDVKVFVCDVKVFSADCDHLFFLLLLGVKDKVNDGGFDLWDQQ